MSVTSSRRDTRALRSRALRDFARAAGGALIFALPMLMTMELWWLGFTLDRGRLAVLVVSVLPLMVLLSRQIGFEETRRWLDDVLDGLIALFTGALVCSLLLILFGALRLDMPTDEILGKIAIQMVPAGIGALLAKSQFGGEPGDEEDQSGGGGAAAAPRESYGGELFLMAVGALFLGFNVAPTEEMILISFRITPWHAVALVVVSLALMHAFVFAVGFSGGSAIGPHETGFGAFIRMTLPGYAIALAISLYLLWIFARTDDLTPGGIAMAAVVLGFPAAIGAAAARLIL